MSNFPSDWLEITIEEVMEKIIDYRGKTPKKSDMGVPLITAKIVKGGRILPVDEFIPESDYDSWMRRGLPKPNDVVMTMEAPLGEVAQLDNRKVALAQRLITLRGKPNLLDNTFLKYFMMSHYFQNLLKARASGTTVLGIKQSELRKISLLLPPLPEQRAIAHMLGSLDDKIEANRRQNETLEATARAIFKSWFVDFDPVHAKARGEHPPGMDAATAALFPDSFEESELGLIPRGWRWGTLRDCCEKVENGGTPKKSELAYWEPPDIAWLTSGKVRQSIITETDNFISQLGFNNSSAKLWEPGTTIVALYGATAGQVSLLSIQSTANQACCGLTPKDEMIFYVYLYTSNSVEALGMQARGSAQQNLSQGLVADFPALIPNNRILKTFQESVEPIFNKWISNLTEARTLAETRDALLPRLISGALRVGEIE
jgi:type I restriction enzyme, S subunit